MARHAPGPCVRDRGVASARFHASEPPFPRPLGSGFRRTCERAEGRAGPDHRPADVDRAARDAGHEAGKRGSVRTSRAGVRNASAEEGAAPSRFRPGPSVDPAIVGIAGRNESERSEAAGGGCESLPSPASRRRRSSGIEASREARRRDDRHTTIAWAVRLSAPRPLGSGSRPAAYECALQAGHAKLPMATRRKDQPGATFLR